MLVLHGIFGSGANWRTFARKLVARRPDWGIVLVDLRMHGASQGAQSPHTLAAAAQDLDVVVEQLVQNGKLVRAVCGHSFGGKVALSYRDRSTRMDQTWILDASCLAHPERFSDPNNSVVRVLRVLQSAPKAFPSREDFVGWVVDQGLAKPLAQWLAMNLEPIGQEYRSRLQIDAIEELLTDYYESDLWSELQDDTKGEVLVVQAGKSDVLDAIEMERLQAVGKHVTLLQIPGAGHWLHVDALPQLIDLVAERLP